MRALWVKSHQYDPPIGVLRGRLRTLPLMAKVYIGRRAPQVMQCLGIDIGSEPFELPARVFDRFVQWAEPAEPAKLLDALRVLSAEGWRAIPGQSRGAGKKRDQPRLEPQIMGMVRGASTAGRGGRPAEAGRRELVMFLAFDWADASGSPPRSGRSDERGFGALVHAVFEWLGLPDGAASYALRSYWADVERGRRAWRPPG